MKSETADRPSLTLAHLYPEIMNLYADRGNVTALVRRAAWREIDLRVREISLGDPLSADDADMVVIGGGQDSEQRLVAPDLRLRKKTLEEMAAAGVVMLAVCGGFQLFGNVYRPATGEHIEGIGLIDMETVAGNNRLIGNVVLDSAVGLGTIVGFENHSGKTYLGAGARPLGKVVHGFGNNGEDGLEGAIQGSVFGTYLHGSLLPKNPRLADHLLGLALARRYPGLSLEPLDDTLEIMAHERAIARAKEAKRLSRIPQWMRRF